LSFLAGVTAITVSFRGADRVAVRLNGRDVALTVMLVAGFAPLYLIDLRNTPWDVGTDEMAVSLTVERIARESPADIFGLSDYYAFPKLGFILLAGLAGLLGEIDLTTMRLVNALFGLGCIAAAYAFFRLLLSWQNAVVATVLLGVNHALVAISRMAMRDNSALLVELIALACLCYGMTNRSLRATLLAGLFAGLGFYVYYPGRMVIVLCLLLLVAVLVFLRDQMAVRETVRHGAIVLFGFALIALPLGVATLQADYTGTEFTKSRLLFLPEGRQEQAAWLGGIPETEALQENIRRGLTTFNGSQHDGGNKYLNYGHGFVDPLTGVLLWLGVAVVGLRFIKNRPRLTGDALALVGFASIYLVSAFVLNIAPNYTRLLIILPFVAYFAAVAVEFLSGTIAAAVARVNPFQASFARWAAVSALAGAVLIWNVTIFADYAFHWRTEGHDLGSAGRYIESRRDIDGLKVYLVADEKRYYFYWGYDYWWRDWLSFFAADGQEVMVVSPDDFRPETVQRPFAVLTSKRAWNAFDDEFTRRYPGAQMTNMRSDGSLFALEVED
jgi:4-amino-4-deoxy-L-arabinose transferase-like glycosyltransferase